MCGCPVWKFNIICLLSRISIAHYERSDAFKICEEVKYSVFYTGLTHVQYTC